MGQVQSTQRHPAGVLNPTLGGTIRAGFLEEVMLKLIPKERIGMY